MSVVIWNPNAGKKLGPAGPALTEESLRALLDKHEIDARIVPTASEDDAHRAVQEALDAGHATIIAAGGDGTIGQIATQLIGKADVTLGMLPLGTVMNFPRMVGVPRDLDNAAGVIAAGRTRLIDVGQANGATFYETVTVGLSAAMFSAGAHFEDGDWGSPLRALTVAFRFQPTWMKIELDDQVLSSRALMVTVSNGVYMGLAMAVAPGARLDDGQFDVRVFSRFSTFELLRHLASITFGRHRYIPKAATYRSARVRITTRRPLPVRADSRDLGTTPLECVSQHAALCVIVGPEFADGRVATDDQVAPDEPAAEATNG